MARFTPYSEGLHMLVHRIHTLPSGDSAIELREVPMSNSARPMSVTFEADHVFFRETPQGHVQEDRKSTRLNSSH